MESVFVEAIIAEECERSDRQGSMTLEVNTGGLVAILDALAMSFTAGPNETPSRSRIREAMRPMLEMLESRSPYLASLLKARWGEPTHPSGPVVSGPHSLPLKGE
jgi:hypothetical protein